MKDDSPIILSIKAADNTFLFFHFSLTIYDILLYDKDYNPDAPTPSLADSSSDTINRLQNRFMDVLIRGTGDVELSFAHVLVLLSIVDCISKALLGPDADRLIAYLLNQFPRLTDDWAVSYLQNAGYIFGTFRDQFGDSPKMEALLERITSLNNFQDE